MHGESSDGDRARNWLYECDAQWARALLSLREALHDRRGATIDVRIRTAEAKAAEALDLSLLHISESTRPY